MEEIRNEAAEVKAEVQIAAETPVGETSAEVKAEAPEAAGEKAEAPVETAPAAETPAKEASVEVKVETPAAEKAGEKAEAPAKEAPAKEAPAKGSGKSRRLPLNASVDPEAFDWASFEGDTVLYGIDDREQIEEAYARTLSKVVENEVVEGTVTAITKREVFITIGYKSEGVIPAPEFRYNPDLKVGDKVEVYVESAEDRKGQLLLSHKKARQLRSWDMVNAAFEKDEVVRGYIKTRTKGGMIVDVFGIEAFLPGSQIDIKPIRDYDAFVDQNMDFKIVKINQEFRNVVVSHKALLEAELEKQKSEIISKLEKGQVLEGTVKNITNYGVFVDLGGVDGLIHITDLSWSRIYNPEEIVKLDEKIKVVVLDFNEQQKRIALGLKQLTPHPWDSLDPELKEGDRVHGKVVLIADYGAFVEVLPGVEGLIHVSEMSWSPRLRIAQDFLKVGDEVEAQILSLDREARKMSLGLKQLVPNPWENIRDKYPVGSRHSVIVRNITNFGVFAELEDGIEGLIHISDLSWSKIKHPSELVQTGDCIEVVILDFDESNHKLSLGHKQILPNPWDELESKFPVGSDVEGTVAGMTDKGANITLADGSDAFCFSRDLVREDGKSAISGEKLLFRVVELRRSTRRILVSHTRTYSEARAEARAAEILTAKNAVKKINSNLERTTLGDISELAALKDKLEKGK